MYFEIKLVDYAKFKLSDLDWDLLEGLEAVLSMSSLLDARWTLIAITGPSHLLTKHVI